MRDIRLWIRLQEAGSAQAGLAVHLAVVERARLARIRARLAREGQAR